MTPLEKNSKFCYVDGEPMFCLTDVCKALAIKNSTAVVKRLDDDERTKLDLGRAGETNFITESKGGITK